MFYPLFQWWVVMISPSNNLELISAEELMSESPDSSFVILQNIDTLMLKSSAAKALYSLLFVQAQGKNYIDT